MTSETGTPWNVKTENRKRQYLIVFGDVDKYVAESNIPASTSLKVVPFVEHLRKITGSQSDDMFEILNEAGGSYMLFMFATYRDLEHMKAECDKDPSNFMQAAMGEDMEDDEGDMGYRVFAIGKELVSASLDYRQVANGDMNRTWDFPNGWEVAKVPMLLRTGEIKEVSSGFAGMLDMRPLTIRIFRWAKERNIEIDDFDKLKHAYYSDTLIFNSEVLEANPNASFTVFTQLDIKRVKPKLTSVV